MIKLFRKTRQKLLMQNKTGQYFKYAIGEIILVVIGILIALYINNLNENRKDQAKEEAILHQLQKDFKKNLKNFNKLKTIHVNSLEASLKFKTYINNPNPLLVKDSIAKYYFLAFNSTSYNPSNGVVKSLISSGEYKLIKNDTLRNYLISWEDAVDDYLEGEVVLGDLWSEKIEPYIINNGDFANLNSPKNFKLITTPKFKNLTERHIFYLRNILRSIKNEPLQNHLNEIVRLSKTTTNE
ncbi:MAG: hypothetical protein JXR05_04155 [Flavobacteriaceae bacterium]